MSHIGGVKTLLFKCYNIVNGSKYADGRVFASGFALIWTQFALKYAKGLQKKKSEK